MSILVDANTKLLIQGMGKTGQLHAGLSLEFGTKVVGGVTPGRGGTEALGMPVFDTVREAVKETGANASVVFVPAPGAADAILEAADAGIQLVCVITEGIPVRDMLRVRAALRGWKGRLIGPNCPGLLDPALKVRIGIAPYSIFKPGSVGVVSRSGTLTYEAVHQLSRLGIGQSTCVGIGGDPIPGTSFVDVLALYQKDPAHQGGGHDRRDRRQRRGRGRRVRRLADEQAGGRVHRGRHRAAGQTHGPCGRDHLRRQGHRRGQAQGAREGGHPRRRSRRRCIGETLAQAAPNVR